MSPRPAVLIMQRHLGPLTPFLESAYDVWRYWEGPPVETEAVIEAMVVSGEHPLDKGLIERLPRLRHLACFTAGYDRIDIDWCRARGLTVTHAPGVNHEDVADHAIGLILASGRRIVDGDRALKAGEWSTETRLITPSMKGRKVGIVGLGGIGEAVARRAEAMRMSVAWWGPRDKPAAWPRADGLMELARDSDILVIACRVDDSNVGLISDAIIRAVGSGGMIVNVSRGQVIDEDALIAALKDGGLGQAALDVFVDEPTDAARWDGVPNTVLTPHTAGATTESAQGMLMLLMQNLHAVLGGQAPVTPVAD